MSGNSELWNTGTKENQEIVRKRKRQLKYFSNVMVLSDAKRPQNEGKVFIFQYGAKIFAKLMNAIEPEFDDEISFNPFDFWEGAPFKIKIRNVEGYRNYDKSEFGDCGPLFDSDEAMEKVWKSQYPLLDFVNPSNFKSFDELKTKFHSVVSAPVVNAEVEQGQKSQPSTRQVAATRVEPEVMNDEDEFALFQSLVDS